ncbi:MAG: dipeptide epimerase [Acidobacteriota bacterium]
MRILRATSSLERIPLSRPYTIAYASFDAVEMCRVRLEADNGLVGLGCGSPAEMITGETPRSAETALADRLGAVLEGTVLEPLPALLARVDEAFRETPAARAAVDLALHDLWGKGLGRPLVEIFGRCHRRMATSVTVGILDAQEALEEAREWMARGFRCLKIKIGRNLEEELELLTLLRAELGDAVRIRVDANQGYRADQLPILFSSLGRLGIELVEQPLPPAEDAALGDLVPADRRLAAGDESVQTPGDARRLAARGTYGVFNIKLMKCGGIEPARRIAATAEEAGIGLMWGCMDESVASLAGALHAAFASPATRFLDLDGSLDLARDPARGGFEIEDGMLRLLDRPGLGIEAAD